MLQRVFKCCRHKQSIVCVAGRTSHWKTDLFRNKLGLSEFIIAYAHCLPLQLACLNLVYLYYCTCTVLHSHSSCRKDADKLEKVKALREASKRMTLSPDTLPSVCFYTLLNSAGVWVFIASSTYAVLSGAWPYKGTFLVTRHLVSVALTLISGFGS